MVTLQKLKSIYLIRHGQTIGNGHHYVGWEDLPLNQKGQSQAQLIANVLEEKKISLIYCSLLTRAIKTAEPLAKKKNIQLYIDSRLNEIHYGAYQGRLKSDLNLKLRKDYLSQRLPEGESLHDVYLRVKYFWDEFSQREAIPEKLAIVSHYWSIRMLYGILQDIPFNSLFAPNGYKPANGSVFELTLEADADGDIKYVPKGYLENKVLTEPLYL